MTIKAVMQVKLTYVLQNACGSTPPHQQIAAANHNQKSVTERYEVAVG